VHVVAATLTIALFLLRAAWAAAAPWKLQRRWVCVVPHAIDTILLAAGAWMTWQIGAAGVRGWLPAKLLALVVYIGLGMLALRSSSPRSTRFAAATGAVLAFAYIVSVAVTKSPLGFFAARG